MIRLLPALATLIVVACKPGSSHGEHYRAPLWTANDSLRDTTVLAFVERALPKLDAQRWGFTIATESLGGHPVLLVRGMIAGGTSGGEEAYYVLDPARRMDRLWGAMARYYDAPPGKERGASLDVSACLMIGDSATLAYMILPNNTGSSRQLDQEDYAPDEHLIRKPGLYRLDASGNIVYLSPLGADLRRVCNATSAS